MMRRLLKGKILYFGLGLLLVVVYGRAVIINKSKPVRPSAVQEKVVSDPVWSQTVDSNAIRESLQSKPLLGLVISALGLLIVVLILGGVVLNIWGFGTDRHRSVWRFTRAGPPRWSFGELARIIALTAMIALLLPFVRVALLAAYPTWRLDDNSWIVFSMLWLDVFVITLILAFALGWGKTAWSRIGLSARNLAGSVRVGVLGYVVVFPWLLALLILMIEISRRFGFEPPMEPIHRLLFFEQRPVVLGLTTLLACVVGPIAEECFFRGVLYSAMRYRTSPFFAMLATGALFSLMHTSLVGFVPIWILGCLLAYLYERTGSLVAPIVVHVFHNTLLFVFAMAFRGLIPSG